VKNLIILSHERPLYEYNELIERLLVLSVDQGGPSRSRTIKRAGTCIGRD